MQSLRTSQNPGQGGCFTVQPALVRTGTRGSIHDHCIRPSLLYWHLDFICMTVRMSHSCGSSPTNQSRRHTWLLYTSRLHTSPNLIRNFATRELDSLKLDLRRLQLTNCAGMQCNSQPAAPPPTNKHAWELVDPCSPPCTNFNNQPSKQTDDNVLWKCNRFCRQVAHGSSSFDLMHAELEEISAHDRQGCGSMNKLLGFLHHAVQPRRCSSWLVSSINYVSAAAAPSSPPHKSEMLSPLPPFFWLRDCKHSMMGCVKFDLLIHQYDPRCSQRFAGLPGNIGRGRCQENVLQRALSRNVALHCCHTIVADRLLQVLFFGIQPLP